MQSGNAIRETDPNRQSSWAGRWIATWGRVDADGVAQQTNGVLIVCLSKEGNPNYDRTITLYKWMLNMFLYDHLADDKHHSVRTKLTSMTINSIVLLLQFTE